MIKSGLMDLGPTGEMEMGAFTRPQQPGGLHMQNIIMQCIQKHVADVSKVTTYPSVSTWSKKLLIIKPVTILKCLQFGLESQWCRSSTACRPEKTLIYVRKKSEMIVPFNIESTS